MAKEIMKQGSSLFEQIKQIDENGNEFWYARQLAKVLEYSDFRNFTAVIKKAKESCANSGQEVSDHLVESNEVVSVGSGKVGKKVRKTIQELGSTMPGNLPPTESIKKV
jgi:DNA-damage-inducible protein D